MLIYIVCTENEKKLLVANLQTVLRYIMNYITRGTTISSDTHLLGDLLRYGAQNEM